MKAKMKFSEVHNPYEFVCSPDHSGSMEWILKVKVGDYVFVHHLGEEGRLEQITNIYAKWDGEHFVWKCVIVTNEHEFDAQSGRNLECAEMTYIRKDDVLR